MVELPHYLRDGDRRTARDQRAAGLARQIELNVSPRLDTPFADCHLLDIGCGSGHTALELARRCTRVVGIEPNPTLAREAAAIAVASGLPGLQIRACSGAELDAIEAFDVAVMDNVLEHIDDQPQALHRMSRSLQIGGVAFLVVPNKLWPIEVHYRLPFLSYLPLRVANLYLSATGRGSDYRDASYAPTYFRLRRLLAARTELDARLALPADPSLAEGGDSLRYRVGIGLIRRFPSLWAISKAFLVVAKKTGPTPDFDQ